MMLGFNNPCSDTGHILKLVKNLMHIYKEGYSYHKGGIILVDLVPITSIKEVYLKHMIIKGRTRMIAVDRINKIGLGYSFMPQQG